MLRTDDRPGHNLTCHTSCPNPVDGAWSPTLLGLWAETAAKAVGRPALTPLSRPFLPRFLPFFRRSFALSGFLASRRRKWAKNGVKWAKNGQDRRLVSSALAALPTAPLIGKSHSEFVWLQQPGPGGGPWTERTLISGGPGVGFALTQLDGGGARATQVVASQFFTAQQLSIWWCEGGAWSVTRTIIAEARAALVC